MLNQVINFAEKLTLFNEHWSPKVVTEMNDYQFKLVKVLGEFVWHEHPDTDEVFIVLKGCLDIELTDSLVHLQQGEMFVVKRGVMHRPVARQECHILLVEPKGVINTGEAGGQLTAANDVWI
ncbi:cupin domain-containing protein [Bowmanella denitrificans]|uniref:Cupin domain-containing protein n=1 Tax=Bowmanella denitrificans TaxID=366582 RepID=A0ABN0WV48_9ALTE|nr:cupin domain-containing protein [Bowmanella denitrificans]